MHSPTRAVRVASIAILVAGALLYGGWAASHRARADVTLQVHGHRYGLEAARTETQQALGLGKRDDLGRGTGMIFVYDRPAQRCFWMKDMRFAIDMIFVDQHKKVVRVEHTVKPDTYPLTFCAGAQYIIELQANETSKAHIRRGTQLSF